MYSGILILKKISASANSADRKRDVYKIFLTSVTYPRKIKLQFVYSFQIHKINLMEIISVEYVFKVKTVPFWLKTPEYNSHGGCTKGIQKTLR